MFNEEILKTVVFLVFLLFLHTWPYPVHGVPNKVICHVVTKTLLSDICLGTCILFCFKNFRVTGNQRK